MLLRVLSVTSDFGGAGGMGGGVVGMDGRMQRYSGHILPCWDGRGEEAEYVGKISGRVGFGLPRAHPILEDRFSHHIIISIPPSFVSEAWPSRSCSLGLPGGCTHGVQQGSRRYCTCCACAHADLEAGGPCRVEEELPLSCSGKAFPRVCFVVYSHSLALLEAAFR